MAYDRPGSTPIENASTQSLNLLDLVAEQQKRTRPTVVEKPEPCPLPPSKSLSEYMNAAVQAAPMDVHMSKAEADAVSALKNLVIDRQQDSVKGNQADALQREEAHILSQVPSERMPAFLGALNKSLASTNYRLASDHAGGVVWMGEKQANGQMAWDYIAYQRDRT
jgi:hypothetical protein